jgi:hypothetical protein
MQSAASSIPKVSLKGEGCGKGKKKNASKQSYHLEFAFLLIQHFFDCYKLLNVFQISDKVHSDSFCLFFMFLWRN